MKAPTGPRPGPTPGLAAVVFARRGWAVFPCHSPTRAGCSCGVGACPSPAKHPRVRGGLRSATTDEAQLARWWGRWPGANVAVRTGAASALVVLDVDARHGGEDTLAALVAEHGPLPPGRTVATGGGRHLYFAHPGVAVANDAGRRLGPGLDVRGDGGYVVAPPSRHAGGAGYALVAGGATLPPMPTWLQARLAPSVPASPRPRTPAPGDLGAWARGALEGELARLRAAPQGARNHSLNRAAYRLGQVVGGGALDEATATAALVGTGVAIGLGEREATATVASGLAAGAANPRHPAPPPPPWASPMGLGGGVNAALGL